MHGAGRDNDRRADVAPLRWHLSAFTLPYRLEMNRQEIDIVRRYRLADFALTFVTDQGQQVADDILQGMLAGRAKTVNDVLTLLARERAIKGACDQVPILLEVCQTFGKRLLVIQELARRQAPECRQSLRGANETASETRHSWLP